MKAAKIARLSRAKKKIKKNTVTKDFVLFDMNLEIDPLSGPREGNDKQQP
jgi:hypothetical protein